MQWLPDVQATVGAEQRFCPHQQISGRGRLPLGNKNKCYSVILAILTIKIVYFTRFTLSLQLKHKHVRIMTAIQLRAELFREMSPLLDSEAAMEKLIKYVKKLSGKSSDPSLMTEEEFFAKVDKSLEQAQQGRVHRIETKEELSQFLNNL